MEYNRCAYSTHFIWGVGRVRISTYFGGGVVVTVFLRMAIMTESRGSGLTVCLSFHSQLRSSSRPDIDSTW